LRSLERSALVEAIEQLSRALDQIATLPSTPALRREEIKLQVALINPLAHVKGLAAPEAKAAAERARLLIEQAEALGEPPEDPQLLISVLTALWAVDVAAFDGDRVRERAAQILALAEKQRANAPLVGSDGLVGFPHMLMGLSLVLTGNFVEGLVHLDQAIKLYDPVEQRSLAKRFWIIQDQRVAALMYRSLALFALGYPDAALAATEQALSEALETGNPTALLNALTETGLTQLFSGNYAIAKAQSDELIVLAEQKGSISWKTAGMMNRAYVLTLMGEPADAVATFASAIPLARSAGTTLHAPVTLSLLAKACGDLGQFDKALSYIDKAIRRVETTKEKWCEAEVRRIAGEMALMSLERDAAKAEACFERALTVARAQQAKSWELRAATSMARLWREQGKRDEARELLAPVYGWFTEGFDMLDLKQAKGLLDELAQ
jgi:predicted ATPase